MYKQRDIVLVPFPYTDLTASKLRPALIISNDSLPGSDLICCLITSVQETDGLHITQKHLSSGTLAFASKVKPYRLFTINPRIVRKKLATVEPSFLSLVLKSMYSYFNQP